MSLPDSSNAALSPGSAIIDSSCKLLGPTALVVQALMGILVIISLIYKRQRERPMRPWKIWLFDVSKQVVGQLFVHSLNVLISDAVSRYKSGDACVFYFLNILIDTTLGVGLLYVTLHALTTLLSNKLNFKGFESGVYGDPPSYSYWMRQAAVYVSSLTAMKFLVLLILIWFPGLFTIGDWLLSWTRIGSGDTFQVVFVMGIFPIIMNILQFWFIDSIVKADHNNVMLDSTADFQHIERESLFDVPSDDEGEGGVYAHRDIENLRPVPPSRSLSMATGDSLDRADTIQVLPDEQKSIDTQSVHDQHSYPPSLSGSYASTSTTGTSPKPAKNLLKLANRRRNSTNLHGTRTPSDSHSIHQPQPRIPQITPAAKSLELEVRDPSTDDWAGSWDESSDWTNDGVKNRALESWDSTTSIRATG
ncbi:hypothetical protein AX15_007302 [Amanita polypyramis BW_CC]|nr:hypothetical protein AX15_007302 [Amanita polypyramis BW_CC]